MHAIEITVDLNTFHRKKKKKKKEKIKSNIYIYIKHVKRSSIIYVYPFSLIIDYVNAQCYQTYPNLIELQIHMYLINFQIRFAQKRYVITSAVSFITCVSIYIYTLTIILSYRINVETDRK